MKRFILLLNCLTIFYAGAVWALEGCRDFGASPNAPRPNESGLLTHHHVAETVPHHSHSEPSQVHCPNVMGEFLVSSRASVESSKGYVWYRVQPGEPIHSHLMAVTSRGYGNGPPSSMRAKDFPRHLLLSVIRI